MKSYNLVVIHSAKASFIGSDHQHQPHAAHVNDVSGGSKGEARRAAPPWG